MLQKETLISPQAALTLVRSMILLADILAVHTEDDKEYHSSTNEPLNLLILAHKLTVKQVSAMLMSYIRFTAFANPLCSFHLSHYENYFNSS